jgi:hypothetical protein
MLAHQGGLDSRPAMHANTPILLLQRQQALALSIIVPSFNPEDYMHKPSWIYEASQPCSKDRRAHQTFHERLRLLQCPSPRYKDL